MFQLQHSHCVSDSAFMVNLTSITNTVTKHGIACEQSASLSDPAHLSFVQLSTSHLPRFLYLFALFTAYHPVISFTEKPLTDFVACLWVNFKSLYPLLSSMALVFVLCFPMLTIDLGFL